MKKLTVIALILMIGVVLSAQMHQHPEAESPRERRGRMECPMMGMMQEGMGRMMEHLELTDFQKEQIMDFRHDHRLEMIDHRADIAKLRLRLQKALGDHEFDIARTLNENLHEIKSEMAEEVINLRERIYQILTDEQREMLKEMPHRRMMEGMEGMEGMRGMRGMMMD